MKRRWKVVVPVIVAILIATIPVACPPVPPPEVVEEVPAPVFTFYFVSHGAAGDPWWAPVRMGMEDASRALGVTTHYVAPDVFSIEELVSMLKGAIVAEPDGIILTMTCPIALDEMARKAIAKGIPIIAVNVSDERPVDERIPYLAYIGQREHMAGYGMARRVLEEFTPTAAVVMITEPGHVGLEARTQGIRDVLEPLGIPVEAIDVDIDPTKHRGFLEAYLLGHPEVDMVFALGPSDAWAAIELVRDWGKVGVIRLATIDLDAKIMAAIEDGTMITAVAQQPYLQGFLPVVWLYLHLRVGFLPPQEVPTGPTLIDAGNLHIIRFQVEVTGGA